MLFGLSCEQTPAEILAAAAYSLRRSSNAKSLCSVVSPNSSKILAATPADFDPDGFLSSSPPTPARQSSLCGVISGCVRPADIPAPPPYVALFDAIIAQRGDGSVVLPFPIWREAFINDADLESAQKAYDVLNPHPGKTFSDKISLKINPSLQFT
jgi:hypothetical protein